MFLFRKSIHGHIPSIYVLHKELFDQIVIKYMTQKF